MLTSIVYILFAGAVGGFLNGIATDWKLLIPTLLPVTNEIKVWRPGIVGNILAGAISALLLWSIYSSSYVNLVNDVEPFHVSLFTVDFSVLVGLVGSRIMTVLLDDKILKLCSFIAMSTDPTADYLSMDASPIDILIMAVAHKSKNSPS